MKYFVTALIILISSLSYTQNYKQISIQVSGPNDFVSVSYTHLRAHETVLDLVCRLLLEKKKIQITHTTIH